MTFINRLNTEKTLYKLKGNVISKKDDNRPEDRVITGQARNDGFVDDMKSLQNLSDNKKKSTSSSMQFIRNYEKALGVTGEALEEKHDLMKLNTHRFYRAMPALFYKDLQGEFKEKSHILDKPAPEIIIDGDCHLSNFGTFKGPENDPVWGLNDFDQAEKGSPEWDLERLATSIVLQGREIGLDDEKIGHLVERMGVKYFNTLKKVARSKEKLHPPYLKEKETGGEIENLIESVEDISQKEFLEDDKKINLAGPIYFEPAKKIKRVSEETEKKIKKALSHYEKNLKDTKRIKRPLKILDVAQKLESGGSSYGLKRYYALAASDDKDDMPIILELKQIFPSSVTDQTGELKNADGEEIVKNKEIMQQGLANPLYGSTEIDGFSYLVREREKEKENTPIEEFTKEEDMKGLVKYAGKVMAYAHCPSEKQAEMLFDLVKEDPGKVLSRLKDFAFSYADKTQNDYREFCDSF